MQHLRLFVHLYLPVIFALLIVTGCYRAPVSISTAGSKSTQKREAKEMRYSSKLCIPIVTHPRYFRCDTDRCKSYEITIAAVKNRQLCSRYGKYWIDTLYRPSDPIRRRDQRQAFEYLNTIRKACGLRPLRFDAKLAKAGLYHQLYIQDIIDRKRRYFTHYEDRYNYPSRYYTGLLPWHRAKRFGYMRKRAAWVTEVLTFEENTPKDSIQKLLTAIYHRMAILRLDAYDAATASDRYTRRIHPHLIANSLDKSRFLKALSPKIVVYPFEGQCNVQRYFYGETPDPIPEVKKPIGNPVSIIFNDYYMPHPTVLDFKLYDAKSGIEVPAAKMLSADNDPNKKLKPYEFALFPAKPLRSHREYTAVVRYLSDGLRIKEKRWSFRTR